MLGVKRRSSTSALAGLGQPLVRCLNSCIHAFGSPTSPGAAAGLFDEDRGQVHFRLAVSALDPDSGVRAVAAGNTGFRAGISRKIKSLWAWAGLTMCCNCATREGGGDSVVNLLLKSLCFSSKLTG